MAKAVAVVDWNFGLTTSDTYFEEELKRNPYSIKLWLSYLQTKLDQPKIMRFAIYERALAIMPRSYKLWHLYLTERTEALKDKSVRNRRYELLIDTYERALVYMNKMPRIWVDYCKLLVHLQRGTLTRKTFDRALQALPLTQHEVIWSLYIHWVRDFGVPQTALKVYRRYLLFNPSAREEYIAYLEEIGEYGEAAEQLATALHSLHSQSFSVSSSSTTTSTATSSFSVLHRTLCLRLCELCSLHPNEVKHSNINVESVLRTCITQFTEEVGRLWIQLAEFYLRQGEFERAREIYEEGLQSVLTVRDFTVIFDAYVKVEESLVTAKIRLLQEEQEEDEEERSVEEKAADEAEISLRLSRLEHLLSQRPLLLNSVFLRQNPHNVTSWTSRAKIFHQSNDTLRLQQTYFNALTTVDPQRASGKLSSLVLSYANLLERLQKKEETGEEGKEVKASDNPALKTVSSSSSSSLISLPQSPIEVYERGIALSYRSVEELVTVYCAYVEYLLRIDELSSAHRLLESTLDAKFSRTVALKQSMEREKARQRASKSSTVSPLSVSLLAVTPTDTATTTNSDVHAQLHKQPKLWSLYLDLEEVEGGVERVCAAYDRCLSLSVATVAMLRNYAFYLQEHDFFEKSFQIYEEALGRFSFPESAPLWRSYLESFLTRYGETKRERFRDIYDQLLRDPSLTQSLSSVRADFYTYCAKEEEKGGFAVAALRLYQRAVSDPLLQEKEKLHLIMLYVKKLEVLGSNPLSQCRAVYTEALQSLSEESSLALGQQFAQFEIKYGEIDRARALYTYTAQFANPHAVSYNATVAAFWQNWREFETQYGNTETYSELLRVHKTVATAFGFSSVTETARAVEKIVSEKEKEKEAEVSAAVAVTQRVVHDAEEADRDRERKRLRTSDHALENMDEEEEEEEQGPSIKVRRVTTADVNSEEIEI